MVEYFCSGAVVKSTYGRDKNKIYIIKSVDNNLAYLINGKERPIECPKKKNFKHLQLLNKSSGIDVNNVVNCDVIKYLKDYIKSSDCK